VVWSRVGGKRQLTHVGTARTAEALEDLKAIGNEMISAGQGELDLNVSADHNDDLYVPRAGVVLEEVGSKATYLWESLNAGYRALGFHKAAGGDEVFRDLVLARIIEPGSKADAVRVCDEAGYPTRSYPTIMRRLKLYSAEGWRQAMAAACAQHADLGPKTLVLFDVTTLYWESDLGDELRKPGFSKERRLEPQVTLGLLATADGFPLQIAAYEGNKAEIQTMLPTLADFRKVHDINDMVVVADSGMNSAGNIRALERAGLWFILGGKMTEVPYQVDCWHEQNPGKEMPDGLILTQPWPASKSDGRRDATRFYRYCADHAKRAKRGIDEQVRKAEDAVAGRRPVKNNKYVRLTGGSKAVNRSLEARARKLAGIKAYETNIPGADPEFIVRSYQQLGQIEKSFRMSKSDLKARPAWVYSRPSIEAHLTIVFTALAVSRWIEETTGWSIKKYVKTLRRYRTTYVIIGGRQLPAEKRIPADVADILDLVNKRARG